MKFKKQCLIRLLSLVLCTVLLSSFVSCDSDGTVSENDSSDLQSEAESSMNDTSDNVPTRVAYIPLDNRPVNKDRVEYLAQSVGRGV